jgi:hypothetical protein
VPRNTGHSPSSRLAVFEWNESLKDDNLAFERHDLRVEESGRFRNVAVLRSN